MAFIPKLVAVLGTIGIGATVFFAVVALLKIEEVDEVIAIAKRKLGRK